MKVIYFFIFSFSLAIIGITLLAPPTSLLEGIGFGMLIFGTYWCGMCADRIYLEYKKDNEIREHPPL